MEYIFIDHELQSTTKEIDMKITYDPNIYNTNNDNDEQYQKQNLILELEHQVTVAM